MQQQKANSFVDFLQSTTARLALSYLAIIMAMSIGFSYVFYNTSMQEFKRRANVPERVFINDDGRQYIQEFIDQRAIHAKRKLMANLVLLNIGALAAGSYVSYVLARRALEPIEQAMEAQSRFTSDASHELRTPLAAIQAENEVVLRKPDLSLDRAKETLRSNLEEVIRLRDLSDGLLQLARADTVELHAKPVHVENIVSEALNRVVKLAQQKDIAVEETAQDAVVLGDERLLTQAVVILLDNAIKYSPNKTTVFVTSESDSQRVAIRIRDEGAGISTVDQTRIFDRFYRVDQSRNRHKTPGHGLGLSLARKIVEQHQGTISVQSDMGKGSIFTISLPHLG